MLLSLKLISEMYLPRESVIASLYEVVLWSVSIQWSEELFIISQASLYTGSLVRGTSEADVFILICK